MAYLLRVHRTVTHGTIVLECGDSHVGVLNGILVVLKCLLTILLKLEEAAVKLVNSQDRPDALSESLAQHSLGLDRHALNAINDHESAIRDTEGSSDLRREVNVAWRIN